MKKINLIIIFVLVGILGFSACQKAEITPTTSTQTLENSKTSTTTETVKPESSFSSKNSSSKTNTSKKPKNSSSENSSSKTNNSKKPKNSSSNSSGNTTTSSKIDPADERMYEYVRNHQVTTKKVKNMSKDELVKLVERHFDYAVHSGVSEPFKLPKSIVFEQGTVLCTFEQHHVYADQDVYFIDFVGEFKAEDLQTFVSQFNERGIRYSFDDTDTDPEVRYYEELFATKKNAIYIYYDGGQTNTFNARKGLATLPMIVYEKGDGIYAMKFFFMVGNPDYLVGELEVQPDGSAKVVSTSPKNDLTRIHEILAKSDMFN